MSVLCIRSFYNYTSCVGPTNDLHPDSPAPAAESSED